MRNIYPAFFSLLRAGLWGDEPDCGWFPLEEEEWRLLYRKAREQTVEGLVYDGMMTLPVHLLPPSSLLIQWTVAIDAMERRNAGMNRTLAGLNRWFERKGVKVWLVKGQGVASCYDRPLHRQCGDIDFYFPSEGDMDKMMALLDAGGIPVERQSGKSISYWKDSFQVEQHTRLVDIHSPFLQGYIKRLIREEMSRGILWEVEGEKIVLPSPLLAHLISNTHILKHLMVVGIGLRQLCDSARICYQYREIIDGERLEQTYRKLGVYHWVQVLHHVLVEELGMPEEALPFPLSGSRNTGWMIDMIWSGGNFGIYDERIGNPVAGKKGKRFLMQLIHRLIPQIRYAPSETFWFPLMQFCFRHSKK